jgi:uncharacterized membrane protein YdjX (TVP38/TMEM64 family)
MIQTSESSLVATPAARRPSLFRRASSLLARLGRLGPLAIAASVLPGVGALVLYGRLGVIAPWLRDHPSLGPFLCAGAFAMAGGAALVPTYALSALCGWSFGFPVGLAATLCGFVAAALVGYVLGRVTDGGRTLLAEMPKWRAIREALATGGFGKEVLVITLAPVAPFALSNVVMAAVRVRSVAVVGVTVVAVLRVVRRLGVAQQVAQVRRVDGKVAVLVHAYLYAVRRADGMQIARITHKQMLVLRRTTIRDDAISGLREGQCHCSPATPGSGSRVRSRTV